MGKHIRLKWWHMAISVIVGLFFWYFPKNLEISASAFESPYFVYLPITLNKFSTPSIFGVEFTENTSDTAFSQVSLTEPSWTRINGAIWSAVSPNNTTERNWSALAATDDLLLKSSRGGMKVVLIIRGAPEWALKYPGVACGPIKSDALDDFALFLSDLVARYSVPPYHVKYWEVWNEPDVDPSLIPGNQVFGCWGDKNDLYYGGGYYAQMLKVAYPAIKAADPQAQVLVGGLLLDCDPRKLLPGKNCDSAKFLQGILNEGGGSYFDGVGFHAYDYYSGALGRYGNANWSSTWDTTGVVTRSKVGFLQSLLMQYGVTGKFLMNTETALICDNCAGNQDFEQTKAYYVAQSYATAVSLKLDANIWFSATGWRNSGLLKNDLSPLPAYNAYAFARKEIGNVTFKAALSYPGVMGYEFTQGNREIWLVWSLDGDSHTIFLPSTPTAVYDVFGNPLSINGNAWNVTIAPVYIELGK